MQQLDYRERKIMLNVKHRLMLQVRGAGEDGVRAVEQGMDSKQ